MKTTTAPPHGLMVSRSVTTTLHHQLGSFQTHQLIQSWTHCLIHPFSLVKSTKEHTQVTESMSNITSRINCAVVVVGGSCVCEEGIFALRQRSGRLTLLFQEVHQTDAQPRVYYFYLGSRATRCYFTFKPKFQLRQSRVQYTWGPEQRVKSH
jgi:hypothetical protein